MRLTWSEPLPAPPAGLCLSREAGSVLVWDAGPALARYGPQGGRELRQRAPADLTLAALSDDGQSVAAVGRKGQVWLLSRDLVPVWERALSRRPVAVALDHLGRRLAVADDAGGLHLFGRDGALRWQAAAARPLARLAFVPEAGALVGAAELGLVCAFDAAGRCAWRDGLAAYVGGLAVSGDGGRVVLACYTGGLCRYGLDQPRREVVESAGPARLVSLSYTGHVAVTADLERGLSLRGADLAARASLTLPAAPVGLAVEALGGAAVCALSSGHLVGVGLE